MEAGYDYLLLHDRLLKRRFLGLPAIFLILLGTVLMIGGGAYYGYAAIARGDLAQWNASISTDNEILSYSAHTPTTHEHILATKPGASVVFGRAALWEQVNVNTGSLWTDPFSYEPVSLRTQVDIQTFDPITNFDSAALGSRAGATRISLPDLRIESTVQELSILDLGNSRAYTTPANTVGHIPDSANPGEAGGAWFFGHLESPLLGEGSVFYDLPLIAEKLRNGEEIHAITDNGNQKYLYRITSTRVVHQDDLELEQSDQATINLVTCVPKLVYDHRLIVTGQLVGMQ